MRQRNHIIAASACILLLGTAFLHGYNKRSHKDTTLPAQDETEISHIPYAALFQQYAPLIGWDWELLAALCYEESHYNPHAHSRSGAVGLMQLMPQTATSFGLNDSTIFVPEENIAAGIHYISRLQDIFSFIDNREEQTKFVIAAYNAGPAHIMDARRLAKRYGRSAYIWYGNTEYWLQQLHPDAYANDSVVLYGAFDATETVNHVRKVLHTYHRIQQQEQQHLSDSIRH